MTAAIPINGYGDLSVVGHANYDTGEAQDGLVAVRLPSLRRDGDGFVWRLDLFPAEALALIEALAAGVTKATGWQL